MQNGNRKKKREGKNREKENKHKTEDNTEKFKPCGSLASKQQAALDGKKEASQGFNPASDVCL